MGRPPPRVTAGSPPVPARPRRLAAARPQQYCCFIKVIGDHKLVF